MQRHNPNETNPAPPFQLQFIEPFTTFREDGTAIPTPFVVDGLLTQGGLSVLGAKPKVGKSSLSRYLATCVAKGTPFLGREVTQGDVILVSLEDPLSHVDNCLGALGYNPETDAKIKIVERLSPDKSESIAAIRAALTTMPNVRIIIVDHLAKFLNLPDLSEYMPVLRGVDLLHDLARDFPSVHVLCLAHSKKMRCEDPFDGVLGSIALRGGPDTNLVLMTEKGHRIIVTETRVGRAIPATILKAEMVSSAGSDVVRDYSLSEPFDQWEADRSEKSDKTQTATYEYRVVDYLAECEGNTATQKDVVGNVKGKTANILSAIKSLEAEGVLSADGTPKVLKLNLSGEALDLYRLP
jgi:AAA domain